MRTLEKGDNRALLRFFRRLSDKSRLYFREDVTNHEVVKRFCDNLDPNVVLPLVATFRRRILGVATLHQTRTGWSRHVGEIRMSVEASLRKKGMAALFLWELIKNAIDRELEIITMELPAGQVKLAKSLEKYGFAIEAELEGHVTDIKGRRHNLLILTNDTIQIWKSLKSFLHDRAFLGF
jgi:hypothetical protein